MKGHTMAKRHHKSERRSESRGYYRGVTGYERSMASEGGDRGMMLEDKNAHANLPTEVKMMTYPNAYGEMPFGYYDDSMHGIDSQMRQDHATAMKQFMPRKGF
jgi:hypothetical protein